MIQISNLSKTYQNTEGVVFHALKEVNLRINKAEFVAIVGKSGSGKSTLLNLLTGIDHPTSGSIYIENQSIGQLSESRLAIWRGQTVGIVFQFFQLIPTLSILENLLLAMDFVGKIPKSDRLPYAQKLLAQVGISDQAHKLPAALSGGQQQRAAIARALANDPPVIIADEPTGNLDSHNTLAIMDLFRNLLVQGKTLILVTHDEDIAQQAHHIVHLVDGEVVK